MMNYLKADEIGAGTGRHLFVDVRSVEEFAEAHIPGSVFHPLTEIDPNVVAFLAAGKEKCVVICQSGARAEAAAQKLIEAGMGEVHVLEGGVTAWEKAGHPLRRSGGGMSIERQIRIIAGSLVVIGLVLSFVSSPWWAVLSGFVGCGLVFAGVTNFCGMGILLSKMPWNRG